MSLIFGVANIEVINKRATDQVHLKDWKANVRKAISSVWLYENVFGLAGWMKFLFFQS